MILESQLLKNQLSPSEGREYKASSGWEVGVWDFILPLGETVVEVSHSPDHIRELLNAARCQPCSGPGYQVPIAQTRALVLGTTRLVGSTTT